MFKVELDALFNRVGECLSLNRDIDFSEWAGGGKPLFPDPVHLTGTIRNTAGVVYSVPYKGLVKAMVKK